jgi:hypothetical protein
VPKAQPPVVWRAPAGPSAGRIPRQAHARCAGPHTRTAFQSSVAGMNPASPASPPLPRPRSRIEASGRHPAGLHRIRNPRASSPRSGKSGSSAKPTSPSKAANTGLRMLGSNSSPGMALTSAKENHPVWATSTPSGTGSPGRKATWQGPHPTLGAMGMSHQQHPSLANHRPSYADSPLLLPHSSRLLPTPEHTPCQPRSPRGSRAGVASSVCRRTLPRRQRTQPTISSMASKLATMPPNPPPGPPSPATAR